jgi:hypothetical protein
MPIVYIFHEKIEQLKPNLKFYKTQHPKPVDFGCCKNILSLLWNFTVQLLKGTATGRTLTGEPVAGSSVGILLEGLLPGAQLPQEVESLEVPWLGDQSAAQGCQVQGYQVQECQVLP